jgi:hypothetical protein
VATAYLGEDVSKFTSEAEKRLARGTKTDDYDGSADA